MEGLRSQPPSPIANEKHIDQLFEKVSDRSFDLQSIIDFAHRNSLDLIGIKNSRRQTILHIASGFGRRSIVYHLLEYDADVNAQDSEGQAPIHYACNHAHNTITRMLIESGAHVNLVDSKGWTPLHNVVARNTKKNNPSYWKVVESLLQAGANPFINSVSGHNCFSRIQDSHEKLKLRLVYLTFKLETSEDSDRELIIDRYLRVKDFFELVKIGDENEIKAVLTKRLINSRLEIYHNITPLHRAAGYNQVKVAEALISSGAEVNGVDDNGRIPLHNAACHRHLEMIKLLCKAGSDLDKQDFEGSTPMHKAVWGPHPQESPHTVEEEEGAYPACQLLRGAGANITIRDNDGKLPFDLAITDEVQSLLTTLKDQNRQIAIPKELVSRDEFQSKANGDIRFLDYIREIMEGLERRTGEVSYEDNSNQVDRIALDEKGWPYRAIVKRMDDTIGVHTGENASQFRGYDIISIEMVLNLTVWTRHKLTRKKLQIKHRSGSVNERLLFHGSTFIDDIVCCGFDQSYANPTGMFGAGLYFAEHSSKSNQYTFGWSKGCPKHNDKSCYECERKLIFTQVALGKCRRTEKEMSHLFHAPPGFSSVSGEPGPNLLYPEYCIYEGDQAYPAFVIRYKITPQRPTKSLSS